MTRLTVLLIASLFGCSPLLAQTGQTWLRVELLVFAQNDYSAPQPGVTREADPQPGSLDWPEPLVRLNDRETEARLRQQQGSEQDRSTFDTGPVAPDAAVDDADLTPNPYAGAGMDEYGDVGAGTVPVQTEWGLPRPWYRLPDSELELRRDASALERSGSYRLLWHGAWMQPTRDSNRMPWLEILAGEEYDGRRELQGVVRLYESRFLHLDIDLWHTQFVAAGSAAPGVTVPPPAEPMLGCEFLKSTWIAPAPLAGTGRDSYGCLLPRPKPAVPARAITETATEQPANAFSQFPGAPAADPRGNTTGFGLSNGTDPAAIEPLPLWQAAHVTRFVDSRRMELGETHYIDHPRLGVIARVTRVTVAPAPKYPPEPAGAVNEPTDPALAPSAGSGE